MQIKRAEEILSSPNIVNVTYQNSPVWIESLHKENSSAQITFIGTDKAMNVPVNELTE